MSDENSPSQNFTPYVTLKAQNKEARLLETKHQSVTEDGGKVSFHFIYFIGLRQTRNSLKENMVAAIDSESFHFKTNER